jgi:hypothetical protein
MTRAPGRAQTVTKTTTTTTTTKRISNRPRDNAGPGADRGDDGRPGQRSAPPATAGDRPEKKPPDQPHYTEVNLRVNEIRCITSTREVDKDELSLIAIKVEGAVGGTKERRQLAARAGRGELVSAGKFRTGDKETYPKTRVLASYDAGGRIGPDPRFYLGAVVVVEQDGKDVDKLIDSAVDAVDEQVMTAVTAAAGTASAAALAGVASGAAVGSVVPIVGTAIGAAAGAAVGLALGQIKAAHADDVFPPKMVELQLDRFPAEPGEIDGSRETLTFKGFKGHYEVIVSWAVR